jgi:hypothetical protein
MRWNHSLVTCGEFTDYALEENADTAIRTAEAFERTSGGPATLPLFAFPDTVHAGDGDGHGIRRYFLSPNLAPLQGTGR